MISHWVEVLWYKHKLLAAPLLPLSKLFSVLASRRKTQLQAALVNKASAAQQLPVIVVGNITVGGTGKTPLVIALVKFLQAQGYSPGVISRGYGGKADYPYQVTAQSSAAICGDEPLLIATSCDCPVVISPKRIEAAAFLQTHNSVDVIISDDGLQHYALARDIEICVVDGQRQLGNGYCLPAGPLREPPARLNSVDFTVVNGPLNTAAPCQLQVDYHPMTLTLEPLRALPFTTAQTPALTESIHAVAAIGNPQRFYTTLTTLGYEFEQHSFVDHYQYKAQDLLFDDNKVVIMTEKDAVKCQSFESLNKHFYLPVVATLPQDFWDQLLGKLQSVISSH